MRNSPLSSKPETAYLLQARGSVLRLAAGCLVLICIAKSSRAQEFTSFQRAEVQDMLRNVADDVKQHYYDPTLRGLDWDAKVRLAKESIDKSDSLNKALSHVAAALDSLHDSHTFFLPPPRPYRHDYGFQMEMIGNRCFVLRVRPGSDAESKGVKPGDEIVTVNGYTPTRDDFWRMEFLFNILRPQPGLHLELRTPAGNELQVDVMAAIRELPLVKNFAGSAIFDVIREMENQEHETRVRYAERGNSLLIVKLPTFVLSPSDVDTVIGKLQKHNTVIFDLRGNPGGSVEVLRILLGGVFQNKVKIADRVGRSSTKTLETEPRHQIFTGKLVVLVDSISASASELFARVVQLEKRGLVIGDQSSGSVMEALHYSHQTGLGNFVPFGASVTEADLRMADGQSLEHKGVVPDQVMLPAASDLEAGRDPVLAGAAQQAGVNMSPEEASKLFPYEWPKE